MPKILVTTFHWFWSSAKLKQKTIQIFYIKNEFNIWIQFLFNPENRDANVATLIKCDTPHLMKFDTSHIWWILAVREEVLANSGTNILENSGTNILKNSGTNILRNSGTNILLFEYARSKTSKSNRYRRGVLFRFASGQFSAPQPPVSPDLWGCKNSLCGNRTLPGCSIWIPLPQNWTGPQNMRSRTNSKANSLLSWSWASANGPGLGLIWTSDKLGVIFPSRESEARYLGKGS